jgi:hypothetical protein
LECFIQIVITLSYAIKLTYYVFFSLKTCHRVTRSDLSPQKLSQVE